MGRPQRQTADYFPHYVGESRTKYILEAGWGNDGYAFWFKLLELLCKTNGHYYDCTSVSNKKYLVALARIPEEKVDEILETLSGLGKIDKELWTERSVIWCQTLVDNLRTMYSKRTVSAPGRPSIDKFPERKHDDTDDTVPETTREKGPDIASPPAESPPKRTRRRASELSAKQLALFEQFYSVYPKKVDRAIAEKAWAKISPEPDEAATQRIIQSVEEAKKYDSRFRERQYTPNPASWLNAKGYLNDYGQTENGGAHEGFKPSSGFRN